MDSQVVMIECGDICEFTVKKRRPSGGNCDDCIVSNVCQLKIASDMGEDMAFIDCMHYSGHCNTCTYWSKTNEAWTCSVSNLSTPAWGFCHEWKNGGK